MDKFEVNFYSKYLQSGGLAKMYISARNIDKLISKLKRHYSRLYFDRCSIGYAGVPFSTIYTIDKDFKLIDQPF